MIPATDADFRRLSRRVGVILALLLCPGRPSSFVDVVFACRRRFATLETTRCFLDLTGILSARKATGRGKALVPQTQAPIDPQVRRRFLLILDLRTKLDLDAFPFQFRLDSEKMSLVARPLSGFLFLLFLSIRDSVDFVSEQDLEWCTGFFSRILE